LKYSRFISLISYDMRLFFTNKVIKPTFKHNL